MTPEEMRIRELELELELAEAEEAEAVAAKPDVSGAQAFGRGVRQGATLGFADEIGGGVQGGLQALANALPAGALEFAGIDNRYSQPVSDTYRAGRDQERTQDDAAKEAHGGLYLTGNLAGGLLAAPVLPGGQLKGLANLVKTGAKLGAASGLGGSRADLTEGEVGGAVVDTAVGTALGGVAGAAGHGLAKAVGGLASRLGGRAARGVAKADQEIGEMAAERAAEATASAKSLAGRTAQDAYKQLEHLRELGALGRLTPEQANLARELTEELAIKAQEKLGPAAAAKAAAGAAYREAVETEAQRAAEAAKEIANPLSQLAPRFKRYALPAIGRAVGMGVGGLVGGPGGAVVGAEAGGLAAGQMRPMQHALMRMAKHPAVRRQLFRALEAAAGGGGRAAPAAELVAGPISRVVGVGDLGDIAPLFASEDEDADLRTRVLAEALRGGR